MNLQWRHPHQSALGKYFHLCVQVVEQYYQVEFHVGPGSPAGACRAVLMLRHLVHKVANTKQNCQCDTIHICIDFNGIHIFFQEISYQVYPWHRAVAARSSLLADADLRFRFELKLGVGLMFGQELGLKNNQTFTCLKASKFQESSTPEWS